MLEQQPARPLAHLLMQQVGRLAVQLPTNTTEQLSRSSTSRSKLRVYERRGSEKGTGTTG